MSLLKTERIVSGAIGDLMPVAQRVMMHFRGPGREVTGQPRMAAANHGWYVPPSWEISIHAPTFRAIGQHRGALKIELLPQLGTTMIRVSAGVFGFPTGTEQLTWKVKLGQLWREIKQSELHDDALLVCEEYLSEAALKAGQDGFPPAQMMLPPGQPPHGHPGYAQPPGYAPPPGYAQPPGFPQPGPAWVQEPQQFQAVPQPQPAAPTPPAGTAFCSQCGAPAAADARFCPSCGAKRG
ncbi:zinc ribbon domain-containing protein [Saccharothrix deserti]|uniref:zinc ribbon domain-containing protein n=1 Tax=Saccharothrix deserti TaxID=2593674 RepID=UPI00131DE721|nr:zinc ribbon domain-containing protein [Saccharothrix deserti]